MKLPLLILLLLVTCAVGADVAVAPGPEPAPWWMRVEEFQGLALKWLTTITIVGGALVAAVMTIAVKLQAGITELKNRANRASAEKQELQRQLTCIAALCPPPSGQPVNPVVPAVPVPPAEPPAPTS